MGFAEQSLSALIPALSSAASAMAFFVKDAGYGGILLLFFVLHLCSGLWAGPRVPALWGLLLRAGAELVRRLNKPDLDAQTQRLRAAVLLIVLIGCGAVIGLAAERVEDHPFGWAVMLVLLAGGVSLMGQIRLLRTSVRAKGPADRAACHAALGPLVCGRYADGDIHAFSRHMLEGAARGLPVLFIAPILWFALAGPVGMMLALGALAAALASGCAAERDAAFSRRVRAVAGLWGFLPAYLSVAVIALASVFVSGAHPLQALRSAALFRRLSWIDLPIAALAGALGVTLGGPWQDGDGQKHARAWLGVQGTSARCGAPDIQRCALLYVVVFIIVFCLSAAFFMFGL